MAVPRGQHSYMFEDVPITAWLLILIALAGYAPARFLFDYIAHSPSRRDVTLPPEDLSWRTPAQLIRSLAILGGLIGISIFIFTPAATAFAQSPSFLPILMAAVGAWTISTVARGFWKGVIEPMSNFHREYNRELHPKRFWVSMGWNSIVGGGALFLGFHLHREGPMLALTDQCYDAEAHTPRQQLSACDRLIAEHGNDADMATWLAWRGSAHFRLKDYARAKADYAGAVHLDPSDSSSYYNLGLVDEREDNLTGAVVNYTAAIRIEADNADAYLQRGLIFLDIGQLDKSIADFTRAHQLKPTNPIPIANRGISYAWMRDQSRAKNDFAAVKAIDPTNSIMLRGEALLHFNAGNMQGAVDKLTASLKSEPGNRWALRLRADAYSQLGNDDAAFEDKDELWRLGKLETD